MASAEKLSTHQKALGINLDPTQLWLLCRNWCRPGSRAVVSGCWRSLREVAKSISAYDKEVSDDLYGSGARYVSKERLNAMVDNEWTELVHQLNKSHGSQTRFFSLSIPVRPQLRRNKRKHGWVGLRFQLHPGGHRTTSCCISI